MTTLLIQFKLVYGPFGQSNMHSTLDFCPRPARKETNVLLRGVINGKAGKADALPKSSNTLTIFQPGGVDYANLLSIGFANIP